MEPAKPPAKETIPPSTPEWARMTQRQKVIYVAKIVVSVLTFGFVFPNISSD